MQTKNANDFGLELYSKDEPLPEDKNSGSIADVVFGYMHRDSGDLGYFSTVRFYETNSDSLTREVFLHEMLHSVSSAYVVTYPESDEVLALERLLSQVKVDIAGNPE